MPIYCIFLLLLFFYLRDTFEISQINFGQSAALTGQVGLSGQEYKAGIDVAFQEINSNGNLPFTLNLITYDDEYNPILAYNNTLDLLESGNVFAILGSLGTATSLAVFPLIESYHVPFIAPLTGSQSLRSPFNSNFINIRASYGDEIIAMVKFLVVDLFIDKIAVVYQNDAFGLQTTSQMEAALRKFGLGYSAIGSYDTVTLNVTESVDIIYASQPKAIVLFGTNIPMTNFVGAYKQKPGFVNTTRFMAISIVNSEGLVSQLGKLMENVYITQVVPAPTDFRSLLVRNYVHSLNQFYPSMAPGFVSLEGYLAGRFVGSVLERIQRNVTVENFRKMIFEMSIFRIDDIRLGPFYFDAKNNPEVTELGGCNQGSKTVYLSSFNQTSQLFVPISQYDFYSSCLSDINSLPNFIIFGSISSTLTDNSAFLSGLIAGIETTEPAFDDDNQWQNYQVKVVTAQVSPNESAAKIIPERISWYNTIIGYIGNEGDVNADSTFIHNEVNKNRIFLGMRTGRLEPRTPFQELVLFLRSSLRNEIYAIIHFLMDRGYSRISLVSEDTVDGSDAFTIVSTELSHQQLLLSGYFKTNALNANTDLLQQLYPSQLPPEAVILMGSTSEIQNAASFLCQNTNAILFFTSLNSREDILNFNPYFLSHIYVTTSFPQYAITGYSTFIEQAFQMDFLSSLSNPMSEDDMILAFEGYVLGIFVTKVLDLFTGDIDGVSFSSEITAFHNFNLGGILLGPYYNIECPPSLKNSPIVCQCNQGIQTVYFYTFAENGSLVAGDPGEYNFNTCGIVLFEAVLGWITMTTASNIFLVSINMLLCFISIFGIFYVHYYRKHRTVVKSEDPLYLFLLLIGITLGYMVVIPLVGEPSVMKCMLQYWLGGLSMAIILSYSEMPESVVMRISIKAYPKMLGGVLFGEFFILTLWSGVETSVVIIDDTTKWESCHNGIGFKYVSTLFNSFLLLIVFGTALKTKIPTWLRLEGWALKIAALNLGVNGVVFLILLYSLPVERVFYVVSSMILVLNTPVLAATFGLLAFKLSRMKSRKVKIVEFK